MSKLGTHNTHGCGEEEETPCAMLLADDVVISVENREELERKRQRGVGLKLSRTKIRTPSIYQKR